MILRAMGRGGDASLLAYNNLYQQLSSMKSKKLIPKSELAKNKPVPLFKPETKGQTAAERQKAQLEKLQSIRNLVLGTIVAGQVACSCGYKMKKDEFEMLEGKSKKSSAEGVGVVVCPSCQGSILGPGMLMNELKKMQSRGKKP